MAYLYWETPRTGLAVTEAAVVAVRGPMVWVAARGRTGINIQAIAKPTSVWATVTMAIFPQHKPSKVQSQGTWRGGRFKSHFEKILNVSEKKDGGVYLKMSKQV